ncbi:Retrovirus-related Pol polyprotein from transposon TNT 1-94 [Trichinella zimbabwensis]|uniref:Retrovirus-related Pol polyprotein from transposon TNT 1-94 n=1 Tax=Trichinella zimbabwensis TaxID=268475 RepID=A0A0V1GXK8_9BILA|nr:Retrovirus-related Pol polyprotein from transposon TNT 1-94 [Trichinella zimbabwensis]
MTFCNGPVAWSSRVQKTIALSTVEAEYMALTESVKEVKWIRQLLMDLGRNQVTPTPLFSDNQGAAFLTKNPQHHRRTKHIDIRYHFIRTEQEEGVVSVECTPYDKQPADMLTKALSGPRHLK